MVDTYICLHAYNPLFTLTHMYIYIRTHVGSLDLITGVHNAVLQRLHPQVELPLVRPYLDKFDKARVTYAKYICVCMNVCGLINHIQTYGNRWWRPAWRA